MHGDFCIRKTPAFLLLIFLSIGSYAQSSSIIGRVIDGSTGFGLPYASIFIDKSTIGTSSSENGKFLLKNVPIGPTELIVSFLGYDIKAIKITVESGEINVGDIHLIQSQQQLSEVEVSAKRDDVWERQLRKFEKIFLGTSDKAKFCTILNPWVINFEEKNNILFINANQPIQIKNNYLGYKIIFYLGESRINKIGYAIKGNILFEELNPLNSAEGLRWVDNRYKSYLRSSRHLFKSIIDRNIKEEGFYLYEDLTGEDANSYFEPSDNFRLLLGKSIIQKDTVGLVTSDLSPGVKKIRIDKRIEIHYHNARSLVHAYSDIGYPVSWILAKGGYLRVNNEGIPLNSNNLITSGDMNQDWIATMLPSDYNLPKNERSSHESKIKDLDRFREQVYVQTDKPYYYPGETIWFKAYLNYYDPSLRDSLSKLMNVDLISPKPEVFQTKQLFIDNGSTYGDFVLPDSLPSGDYYLRAYTSLQRNFGDSLLYEKHIPVLKINEKVDPSQSNEIIEETNLLSISANKPVFSTREEVKLQIEVRDESGTPLASNLSISVTDIKQVMPVSVEQRIVDYYPFNETNFKIDKLLYPIDNGVTLSGKALNNKGRPVSANVNAIDVSKMDMILTKSDNGGRFRITGLEFYDSAEFLFQAKNKKNKNFGKIVILPNECPKVSIKNEGRGLQTIATQSPQRIISIYEAPEQVRLLEEVVITEKRRIEEEDVRTYGKADYVLDAKDINTGYGNLLFALQNKFPGLIIRQSNNPDGERWVVYTQRGASVKYGKEVLILLNDVAMTGSYPGEFLASINPANVKSIGFTTRINPLYGEQGAFGVLSIYTKIGPDSSPRVGKQENFQSVKVVGYSKPRKYLAPNYNEQKSDTTAIDYRSTIYWNPMLTTDVTSGTAEASFYAADLETQYRVIVEGVTIDNRPLHGEYSITVSNK